MIIDTSKIRDLVASDITGYRVAQLVNVSSQSYNAYKNGKKSFDNITLVTAEELMKIVNYTLPSPIKLIAWEEGKIQTIENFQTFEDVKKHLMTNDYFSWINDNEPEKELPDFSQAESVEDIQEILDQYDYTWWSMELVANENNQ